MSRKKGSKNKPKDCMEQYEEDRTVATLGDPPFEVEGVKFPWPVETEKVISVSMSSTPGGRIEYAVVTNFGRIFTNITGGWNLLQGPNLEQKKSK